MPIEFKDPQLMSDDELSSFDKMVIDIWPREKEDLGKAVAIINRLSKLGKTNFVWIVFSGYDADSREVWMIPECIDWARKFLSKIRGKISVLADDLTSQTTRWGLGIAALHVVAGYGTCEMRLDGQYEMTVCGATLETINRAHRPN